MRPEYEFGDEVRVLRNVRNDGTFPGVPTGTLLIRRGSVGVVRDIGTFLQDQIIYTVHFLDQDKMVGCRGEELQPADAPWVPSVFENREKVAARVPLGSAGKVLVEQGEVGEVTRVLRDLETGVQYHVHFDGRNLIQVPESALTAPEVAANDQRPEDTPEPSP